MAIEALCTKHEVIFINIENFEDTLKNHYIYLYNMFEDVIVFKALRNLVNLWRIKEVDSISRRLKDVNYQKSIMIESSYVSYGPLWNGRFLRFLRGGGQLCTQWNRNKGLKR